MRSKTTLLLLTMIIPLLAYQPVHMEVLLAHQMAMAALLGLQMDTAALLSHQIPLIACLSHQMPMAALQSHQVATEALPSPQTYMAVLLSHQMVMTAQRNRQISMAALQSHQMAMAVLLYLKAMEAQVFQPVSMSLEVCPSLPVPMVSHYRHQTVTEVLLNPLACMESQMSSQVLMEVPKHLQVAMVAHL